MAVFMAESMGAMAAFHWSSTAWAAWPSDFWVLQGVLLLGDLDLLEDLRHLLGVLGPDGLPLLEVLLLQGNLLLFQGLDLGQFLGGGDHPQAFFLINLLLLGLDIHLGQLEGVLQVLVGQVPVRLIGVLVHLLLLQDRILIIHAVFAVGGGVNGDDAVLIGQARGRGLLFGGHLLLEGGDLQGNRLFGLGHVQFVEPVLDLEVFDGTLLAER